MKKADLEHIIDYSSCPLLDAKFTNQCFEVLSREGALILKNFLTSKQDDIKQKSNNLQNLHKFDSLKVFTNFINKI